MQKEPTVYFPRELLPVKPSSSLDLSSASRYGKMEFILSHDESPSFMPGPCMNRMRSALKEFNPEQDFIADGGGDKMGLALMMLVLRDMNFRTVRYLRWERERLPDGTRVRAGYYVPVTVPLY